MPDEIMIQKRLYSATYW